MLQCVRNGRMWEQQLGVRWAPAPITPAPVTTTAKAKFAYTGNQGASLSGYSVDISTGALTALSGFPLPVDTNPIVVAVDPQNRFLFAGDIFHGVLHVFNINSSTGALSEIGASPYATVDEPEAIAIDPSGTHVYVAGQHYNSVGGFSLSAAGMLTPIAGSPYATSGLQHGPEGVIINEFSIGSTGALTKIPGLAVAAGTTPWGIAFTTQ